jgi:hypothetical protein
MEEIEMKIKKILLGLYIIAASVLVIILIIFILVGFAMTQVHWKGVAEEYITQNDKYKVVIEYGYQALDMVSHNIKIITYRLSDNKEVIVTEDKAYTLNFIFTEYENGDVNILNDNEKGNDYNYKIIWSELYNDD